MKSKLKKIFGRENAPAPNFSIRSVDIEKILMSGENGLSSHQYARMTGKLLRPSTPIVKGPHKLLLDEYSEMGERLFEHEVFSDTAYFKNAAETISFTGRYFEARTRAQIVDVARAFVAAHNGTSPPSHTLDNGHNKSSDPIVVHPISNSDCFTLYSGNHRLASMYVKGVRQVQVQLLNQTVTTPLQDMLGDVHWLKNRRELYQPVPCPEVQTWPLVRKCSDRWSVIERKVRDLDLKTALDVGCSYGWFVRRFQDAGLSAVGVDRDLFALKICELVYAVNPEQLVRSDILDFLATADKQYDVVSCFSVLHHFALGLGAIGPDAFVRMLDKVTGTVLFFDTGQGHEEWFSRSLSQWDNKFIIDFVEKNTSFTKVVPIGVDTDNEGYYSRNYGRTLFMCTRA